MKAKIKKNIKNLIRTLLEAHVHVMNLLEQKKITEANSILAQCQECAVHIGENIEKSEGMDTQAVHYLEIYCEKLYGISRTVNKKNLMRLKFELDRNLFDFEDEIDKRIPIDRLKVVFMPYKASMWDCMESVWEAACMDKECDVKVVPIPYYERNQQGKLEKFCYEQGLFPKYISITPYDKYSIEIERPDIVYIHNPYDNNNYVTCVHPDYFSYNLKKFVDELVYIPYYILGKEPMGEMHRNLPAYKYVDKIIVQDREKADSLLKYIPEEKVVAIGSPKVDRILKLEKEKNKILEQDIPQDWRNKIAGKKVILFNISITGILENSEHAIDKIQYVISRFKGQKRTVLLWRPHPLIEATLKSMRPEMYKKYLEIKNKFILAGEGILDETGDAGIASVIADAYLGENSSSLVHYFGILNKPVLYIDWKIIRDDSRARDLIYFNGFWKENNNIYFVPHNVGLAHSLYEMNLRTGIIKKNMDFPGKADNIWASYLSIKKIQNKIIFIPANAEDIYVYDTDKEQAVKIVLPYSQQEVFLFDDALEYNGKLFLLPQCYPAILSLDLETLEITEYKECVKAFKAENEETSTFIWAYTKKGKYLYLAGCNESKILIFDMEDGSFEIRKIGKYLFGYSQIIDDGEDFWLSAYKKNSIVRWNEKSGDTWEYSYPIKPDVPKNMVYSWILNKDNEIIIFYGFSLEIIFLNKKTGECRKKRNIIDKLKKAKTINRNSGFSFAKYLDDENVIMFNYRDCSVHVWNIYTDDLQKILCRLPSKELWEIEKKQIERNHIVKSTPYCILENTVSISRFIEYISQGKIDGFKNIYECYQGEYGLPIGNKIHEYIKNEVVL